MQHTRIYSNVNIPITLSISTTSSNAEDVIFKLIANYQEQGKGREIWKTPRKERGNEKESINFVAVSSFYLKDLPSQHDVGQARE